MNFLKCALLDISMLCLGVLPASAQNVAFGLVSEETVQSLREKWAPLVADMNRKTGMNVSLYFAANYASIIKAMRDNKIQFGHFGNKSAMEAWVTTPT